MGPEAISLRGNCAAFTLHVAVSQAFHPLAPRAQKGRDGSKIQEASVENWDEIRTAYQVARLGTVSGAAEVLGVHHATVIRHVDALEKRLSAPR